MPFALVFAGFLMVLTAAKDTYAAFGKQVASEFQGKQSFTVWLFVLAVAGAVGYVDQLRAPSRAFMALIIISMLLANSKRGSILTMLLEGLTNPVTPAKPVSSAPQTDTKSGDKKSDLGSVLGGAGTSLGAILGGPVGATVGGTALGGLGNVIGGK